MATATKADSKELELPLDQEDQEDKEIQEGEEGEGEAGEAETGPEKREETSASDDEEEEGEEEEEEEEEEGAEEPEETQATTRFRLSIELGSASSKEELEKLVSLYTGVRIHRNNHMPWLVVGRELLEVQEVAA